MPFTPFHFGPGATVKAMAGQHFSFTVFAFTQVTIDLEPLYFMLRDDDPLHRFLHTYVGATAVALVSIIIGRPICEWALRVWNSWLSLAQARWLAFPPTISLASAAVGAFIGAYSHIALDSIMHADMRPLAPLVESNSLLGVVSIDDLHGICVMAGLVGLAVLFAKRVWERLTN